MAVNDTKYRYATQTWYADGTRTDYEVAFDGGYIRQSDVVAYSVRVDANAGLEVDRTSHPVQFLAEFDRDGWKVAQIRIAPAVAAGRKLVVYRNTEKSEPLVNFADGSILTERNLDLAIKQVVMSTAEVYDLVNGTIGNVAEQTDFIQAVFDQVRVVYEQAKADLIASYYKVPVVHAADLEVLTPNTTVSYNGAIYSANPEAVPFTTTGTFDPTKWRLMQGVVLPDMTTAITNALIPYAKSATVAADIAAAVNGLKATLAASSGASLIGWQGAGRPATTVAAHLDKQMLIATEFPSLQAAIDAAQGEDIWIPRGAVYAQAGPPNNPLGSRFYGGGSVTVPATGGVSRITPYAYDENLVYGLEHRQRLYLRMNTGSILPIKGHMWGDSTVAPAARGGGAAGVAGEPQNILETLGNRRGLRTRISIANHAIGGTMMYQAKTSGLSPLAALANDVDWFIFKYGINDAGRGIVQFAADVDSLLSEIRAAPYGSVNALTITLVGPNSTYDATSGRNSVWYEQANKVLRQAAEKHKCVFINAYAMTRDSSAGAGYWLDNPYNNGNGIHPLINSQFWIWGKVFDSHFGADESSFWRYNHFNAIDSSRGIANPNKLGSDYDYGLTIERAVIGSGWPVDGSLITTRSPDNIVMQVLQNYSGMARLTYRVWNPSNGTWSAWTGRPTTLTLTAGWSPYGSTFRGPAIGRTAEGLVTIEGLMNNGTTAPGTVFSNIPDGYRPVGDMIFPVVTPTGTSQVRIAANGDMSASGVLNATWTSLSGISYWAV